MWQLSLLHGAFLWGGLAVGVPLALHLMMRRQPRHLEFPALRFIRQRESANRRQLKLRHLLLLALRMAFILLLAAALARPSLQGSGWLGDQEAPVAAALVIDTHPRMEYRNHNTTRLEASQDTAQWLLPQLPRDSEVAVLDSHYRAEVAAFDIADAKRRIKLLKPSAASVPLALTIGDALELLRQSDKPRKELYVFTDLSKANWSPAATEQLHSRLAQQTGLGLYLIDVGVDEPQNYGIVDVHLSSESVSKGATLTIDAELAHTGPAGERTIELYLLDENRQPAKRSETTVQFAADSGGRAEFRLGGLAPGLHQGHVKIAGEDALAADDVRFFTVEVKPAWKVLLAAPQPVPQYTLFLSEAIAPYALRIKGAAAFQCETVPQTALLKKPLSEYAAVCLLDPQPLAEDVWRQLGDYVEAGGGLAVFLGRNAQPVESFNGPSAQRVLAGKLLRQSRDETFLRPSSSNMNCSPSSARWKARFPGTAFPSIATGCSARWPRGPTW